MRKQTRMDVDVLDAVKDYNNILFETVNTDVAVILIAAFTKVFTVYKVSIWIEFCTEKTHIFALIRFLTISVSTSPESYLCFMYP